MGQHMSLYFTYRWRIVDMEQGFEVQRARKKPNQGKYFEREEVSLKGTQAALIFVIAGLCIEIDRRIREGGKNDELLRQPFGTVDWSNGLTAILSATTLGGTVGARQRILAARDPEPMARARALAQRAPEFLRRWREFLANGLQADIRDTAVERDGVRLLEALRPQPLPTAVTTLFEALVHDSMAGFEPQLSEFMLNGQGIAKFRRIFFGDKGDKMLRDAAGRRNKASVQAADKRRADRARLRPSTI